MLDPKCKNCRTASEKLFLKGARCFTPNCSMVRNPTKPGPHGKKRSKSLSEYGSQLREKQKLKFSYILREKQMRKYFESVRSKSDAGNHLLAILETRLDNVVFRLGFAKSRETAKQMVSHGHFKLNGRRVNIPSIGLKKNDVITIREESRGNGMFKDVAESIKRVEAPIWLSLDIDKLEGKVVSTPEKESLPQSFNLSLIVEFYSR